MAITTIKLETKVTGDIEAGVVFEKDQSVSLAPDGSGGLQSVDDIDVADGILNMQFHGQGLTGTAWTLTVTQLDPGPGGDLFKKEGVVGSSGHSLIVDAVFV